MKILNIVICYKNEEEVIDYANSLSQLDKNEDIALVIVINQCGNMQTETFKSLLNSTIEIFICDPKENLGYMNGLIYGYEKYIETYKNVPQWVIMSNTDISYEDSGFIKRFLDKEYSNNIWCIGPSIYSPSKNSYDNPIALERRPVNKINFLIFIFSYPWIAAIYFALSKLKASIRTTVPDSQFVYEVHGCYFIIRGEFAELLKAKKYGAFLFSEEAYIAELVRINNKNIYYDNDFEVFHNEHSTTGKLINKKKCKYFAESLKLIKKEFYNS